MKKFVLVTSIVLFIALWVVSAVNRDVHSEDGGAPDQEPFPITTDFQCPRNFGFHVGDEIPLTLVLEVRDGCIVDLVNLPKEKDIHGHFEIRKVKIEKRRESDRTVHTVSFRLQTFDPAIAVDRLTFPPLRISYATKQDWNPKESRYQYQSLMTQAYDIFISRTATYVGPMKDIKGPIIDHLAALIWKLTIFGGGFLVLVVFVSWTWGFILKRRRIEKQTPILTAGNRAIEALNEAREKCFNYEDHRKHLFVAVNAILREFLKEVYGLPSANRPSMAIVHQLKTHPFYEDLKGLAARINQVVYEGEPPADVEAVVREFSGLLKKIDGKTVPEAQV